ncbi:TetR/AcrR family transcriptional regulator [Nocardioides sp. ChNu-153]|uniref:TetR/AcrR family transcriptional regulator n=1 Tax=Nocardioides sp. ChNu-153 TaxID=2779364 RepID=UPI002653B1C4|nr:TetR/AcrR family transcriptional regulator [Nocardioides sp. ChNu-153]MDN7122159.1 TetR/AcrR family transcriptional regulator [Nocardioides sp. ChNu-153]
MATEDRRSRRTRSALRRALVDLVLERGYAAVTVEQVVERADVGRATFYTHFSDKQSLYDDLVAALLADLAARLEPGDTAGPGFTGRPVHALFEHAEAEEATYRMVLRGDGDGRALRSLTDALAGAALRVFEDRVADQGLAPRVDLRVLARAWVGEQLAVLTWWLAEAGRPLPRADVVGMLADLARHGRWWATGFGDDAPDAPAGTDSSAPLV